MTRYILTVPKLRGFCDASIMADSIEQAKEQARLSLIRAGCTCLTAIFGKWSGTELSLPNGKKVEAKPTWTDGPDHTYITKVILPTVKPNPYSWFIADQKPWYKYPSLFIGWARERYNRKLQYQEYLTKMSEYEAEIADAILREKWEPGVHLSYRVPICAAGNERFIFLHQVPDEVRSEFVAWLNHKAEAEYADALLNISDSDVGFVYMTWREANDGTGYRRAIDVEIWEDFNTVLKLPSSLASETGCAGSTDGKPNQPPRDYAMERPMVKTWKAPEPDGDEPAPGPYNFPLCRKCGKMLAFVEWDEGTDAQYQLYITGRSSCDPRCCEACCPSNDDQIAIKPWPRRAKALTDLLNVSDPRANWPGPKDDPLGTGQVRRWGPSDQKDSREP